MVVFPGPVVPGMIPAWSAQPRMNFEAINSGMRTVKLFAAGGVFQPDGSSGGSSVDALVISGLVDVINNLNQTLAGGIRAGVVLSDIQDAAGRKSAIQSDATMK
jgi:hypothetical protein